MEGLVMIKNNQRSRFFGFLIPVLIVYLASPLSAQSNDILDDFLSRPEADLATTAWLVYLASGELPADATPDDALALLRSSRVAVKLADANMNIDGARSATFGEFAYLAMETFDQRGGLFYTVFPGPRYAAREFSYRRWVPGRPMPDRPAIPWEVTTGISEILSWKEAHGGN